MVADVWVHLGRNVLSLNEVATWSCAAMPETGESISDYISYSGIRACQARTRSMPKQQATSPFIFFFHSATVYISTCLDNQNNFSMNEKFTPILSK